MIKKILILLAPLTLAACESCFDATRTANATLGEIVYQSNLAHDANYINDEALKDIDKATDQAGIALLSARQMCVAEDGDFRSQMAVVKKAVREALDLYQANYKGE